MDKLLEQLIRNLIEEKKIYSELLDLSEHKKRIIIEKRIKDLEKIVELEQGFIINIGKLEDERQGIIEHIAAEKDVRPKEITISTLIAWSSGQMRLQFQEIREEFSNIVEKQKAINHINERLLKTNLEYVDFAIHFFTGNDGSNSVYEKQGQASQIKQSRNFFDKKV